MPKATKRERQRQNRDMRREAMLAAEKRRKRFRTARTIGLLLIPIVIIFVIIQLTSGDDSSDSSNSSSARAIKCSNRKPATPVKTQTFTEVPATTIDVNAQYSAVLHTSCGDIDIALDAKQAPVATNNFLALVQNEYYNGTTFHRIVTDFVDQGGVAEARRPGATRLLPSRSNRRPTATRSATWRWPTGADRHLGIAVLPRGEQERGDSAQRRRRALQVLDPRPHGRRTG